MAAKQTYYCSDCYNDYYLPPPPPEEAHQGQQVSPYIIVAVALLTSFFLLVSYYLVIVKYCSRWNRFRPAPPLAEGREEDVPEQVVDHPIWYINTAGLQPSVIDSITVFRYKKGEALIEGRDCSICLNEFREDETLRLLPKCSHAFHIPCIDTWLRSHTNCPLCRAGILSNAAAANCAAAEERQMENSGRNGEAVGEIAAPQQVRRSVSIDSSSVAAMAMGFGGESVGNSANRGEISEENDGNPVEIEGQSSLQKSPNLMRRSFSWGGRLFLPRHSRNSSSILPL